MTPYRLSLTDDGHLWFCIPLRGGWTACYLLVPRDGRPVVVELRLLPTPSECVVHIRPDGSPQGHHEPPGETGLTAAVLKDRVVIGRHIYEVLPAALRSMRDGQIGRSPVVLGGRQTTLFDALFGKLINPDMPPKRGRRGPKGRTDAELAKLAADYLKACESGSRSPVADVARVRGMTDMALRTVLYRARKRGLLTKQTTGRAGGQLTPRARVLLRHGSKRRVTR